MENMELYDSFRAVPDPAKKEIKGGRLKGMTDINPMWRIQALTNRFGPCGMGWKYVIREKRLEHGPNNEVAAFVDIDLYYAVDGVWSDPVPGTGGASFVANERGGLYVSDECFKMALTDALSVACKALGMGADVYWSAGRQSKYDQPEGGAPVPPPPHTPAIPKDDTPPVLCADCGNQIRPARKKDGSRWLVPEIVKYCDTRFGRALCDKCITAAMREEP